MAPDGDVRNPFCANRQLAGARRVLPKVCLPQRRREQRSRYVLSSKDAIKALCITHEDPLVTCTAPHAPTRPTMIVGALTMDSAVHPMTPLAPYTGTGRSLL